MRTDSADRVFQKSARHHTKSSSTRLTGRSRIPSTSGYLLIIVAGAAALFFALLLSGGDDAPWVPAGLAASIVMLVTLGAREALVRRASRYAGERERADYPSKGGEAPTGVENRSIRSHSAALRAIQKQSASADASAQTEAHLDAYHLCREYLASTDEALRLPNVLTEKRVAMRAGQEKVRALQKHHLLSWAREASRSFTNDAQLRARLSDKIEAASRALNVISSALKLYPAEDELVESEGAIREFMASLKIAHWLELAERAAFRGHYRRAIDRYRDALFYVSREKMGAEARTETVLRIEREIDALRVRAPTSKRGAETGKAPASRPISQEKSR